MTFRALARISRSFRRDQSGVTVVEFAMVAPVLCISLLGLLDMGYQAYVGSVVQGTLHEAARMATIGNVSGDDIDAHVEGRLSAFSRDAEIVINRRSYSDFSGVRRPERITQDTAPLGEYNVGDCFDDANRNGVYDLDRGREGFGQSEDIVQYEVVMRYNRLIPLGGLLGWSDEVEHRESTVLRNQPYAARSTGSVIVCS